MITDLFLAMRFLREGRSQTLLIVGGVALGSAVVVFLTRAPERPAGLVDRADPR